MPKPHDNLFSEFHTSLKRGPFGHALGSCYKELSALFTRAEYLPLLKSLCTLGGLHFRNTIKFWLDNIELLIAYHGKMEIARRAMTSNDYIMGQYKDTFMGRSINVKFQDTFNMSRLRKLTAIADKNGKTRIIALFDYWSQTVLKPLHDYIMDLLSYFPDDCTKEQGDKLARYPQIKSGQYWCFDLKSATDRFPVSYQCLVLSKLIGKERTEAWKDIMVSYDFTSPVVGDTKPIKYGVGQPLGAYSSWAVFTLSHMYYYITVGK